MKNDIVDYFIAYAIFGVVVAGVVWFVPLMLNIALGH